MYDSIEKLCKKFAPYVTGNYRDNHLNIYIRKYPGEEPDLSCYGLGKANWSGTVEEYEPFYKEFRKVLEKIPEKCVEIHIEYFCGRINKIEKEFDD